MRSHQSEGVATIWLSNGMIFGLLITQPKRRWLAYFLAGLTADTLADVLYGDPFRLAFGVSLANFVEVVTSTLLLTLWFDSPLDLSKRKSLIGFLLISVLGATALTSALGAWWTVLRESRAPFMHVLIALASSDCMDLAWARMCFLTCRKMDGLSLPMRVPKLKIYLVNESFVAPSSSSKILRLTSV